jgi:UDP:flavonoid glycosyltransferase YjiC (YdhE family)
MPKKKVLFISGSIGLSHVIRDLAIAKELHRQNPEMELLWLACPPASTLIEDAGERLLTESDQWANANILVEKSAAKEFGLNLMKYLTDSRGAWGKNAEIFEQVVSREQFDLVIGDEAYEISMALKKDRNQLQAPFVMIYDFIGCDAMSWNPLEKFLAYMWNRQWAENSKFYSDSKNIALFAGELPDVPDISLGPFLPSRRAIAKETWKFIGYILHFDPADYADRAEIKAKLGYKEDPLVICSIGGTAVGKSLLALCSRAYPIAQEKIPGLQKVLVYGPHVTPDSFDISSGIETRGYVPALYEHFAASDLAIVQAGGNTTIELTALGRPFLYFPLEDHFEQQIHVTGRLERHRAGIKMQYSQTTPETLAEMIVSNIGKEVTYPPIPIDGAQRAVQLIKQLL